MTYASRGNVPGGGLDCVSGVVHDAWGAPGKVLGRRLEGAQGDRRRAEAREQGCLGERDEVLATLELDRWEEGDAPDRPWAAIVARDSSGPFVALREADGWSRHPVIDLEEHSPDAHEERVANATYAPLDGLACVFDVVTLPFQLGFYLLFHDWQPTLL